MKNLFLGILICTFFSCANSQGSQFEFEDKLYECVKEEALKKDINPDEIISKAEAFLISNKILASNSADDYLKLANSIQEGGKVAVGFPEKIIADIMAIPSNSLVNCPVNQDSVLVNESRTTSFANQMKEHFEKLAAAEDLGDKNLGVFIFGVFNKEDLKHPIFRIQYLKALILIEKLDNYNYDQGVRTKLPTWSDEEPDLNKIKPRNVYSVLVNSKNELLVRDKPMKISDLKEKAKMFISNPNNRKDLSERPDKAIISLKNHRGTKYEVYIEVLNELKAAYNELRNEEALKLYKKPYEELEREQQQEIRKLIPLAISEAEPTAFGEEG